MKFKEYFITFLINIIFVKHVVNVQDNVETAQNHEESALSELFFSNLEEDYKSISNLEITPEIQNVISNRYRSFKDSRRKKSNEGNREKRSTRDIGEFYQNSFY